MSKSKLSKAISRYYFQQWKQPIRLLYKSYGITIWKWCGVYVPCIYIHLNNWYLSWGIFHNGVGFTINFYPAFLLNICVKGKIVNYYKRGIFRILINKWEWHY